MRRKSKTENRAESGLESHPTEPAGSTSPAGSEPARAVPKRKRRRTKAAFELAHPNAAGIDIGSASHVVSVPRGPGRQARSRVQELYGGS